jgi:plasmid stabilization system protein ParE
VKNEEKLHSILSPQQREQLEKLKDCIIDMNNISEKEAFVDGFRLGVQLIAESIYDKSGEI